MNQRLTLSISHRFDGQIGDVLFDKNVQKAYATEFISYLSFSFYIMLKTKKQSFIVEQKIKLNCFKLLPD